MKDFRFFLTRIISGGVLFLLIGGMLQAVLDVKIEPSRRPEEFHFVRIQFNSYGGGWIPGWAQDYPYAETSLLTILSELTTIQTTPQSFSIVRLDDPEIMNYPLIYFSEPGGWMITPQEAANLREYLDRGGFAIFDDFDGPRDWANFQRSIRQVLPERNLQRLTIEHPIFQQFYEIETLDVLPPAYLRHRKPEFWGISDEAGRLQLIVNFNNDIGDYWEWSSETFYPINLSNEAFKFGVNYVIYAMSH
jgi:hypothetical protein